MMMIIMMMMMMIMMMMMVVVVVVVEEELPEDRPCRRYTIEKNASLLSRVSRMRLVHGMAWRS
jgi:hypothetical protein